MMEYRTKQPGDVLALSKEVAGASIGYYVLVNPYSDTVLLCLLGEDPDSGDLVMTERTVSVPLADLSCFQPTGLSVEIAGALSIYSGANVDVGDILEPVRGASVPVGLYQVIKTEGTDVLLSRVHSNEDGKLATTSRVSWISQAELGSFRRLRIMDALRP